MDGAHIALVGDLKYGRTVHSLVKLLAVPRTKFTLVSPPTLEMPAYIVDQIATNGHVIEQTTDLAAGLRGADVVYATRIQKERFTDESFEGYAGFPDQPGARRFGVQAGHADHAPAAARQPARRG